jgi:hypothetical protein
VLMIGVHRVLRPTSHCYRRGNTVGLDAQLGDVVAVLGGVKFNNGLYRVHTAEQLVPMTSIVTDARTEPSLVRLPVLGGE